MTFVDPTFSGPTEAKLLPSNILLLQALGINDRLSWNGPSWSISAEFWTYLIFALVLLFVGFVASRFAGCSKQRATGISLAALLIASYVALVALSRQGMDVSFDWGLLRCLCGFLAGHFTYRAWRAATPKCGTVAEVFVIALVIVFVTTAGHSVFSFGAPLIFSAAIYFFASEEGIISAWMSIPIFDWLGRVSYSIYLWHAFIVANFIDRPVQIAARLLHRDLSTYVTNPDGSSLQLIFFGGTAAPLFVTITYLAAVLVVAAFSSHWIERPAANLLGVFLRRQGTGYTFPPTNNDNAVRDEAQIQ